MILAERSPAIDASHARVPAVRAVRHAQAARDWGLAARLLSDHFIGLTLDDEGATAHELLARFPAKVVAADPGLTVLAAADELSRGSLEAAQRHLRHAERGLMSVPADRRGRLQVNLAVTRLSLTHRRGDLPAVVAAAHQVLALTDTNAGHPPPDDGSPDEDARAVALFALGTAELCALRAAEAERYLDQVSVLARRIGRPRLELGALTHGGLAASFRSLALAAERFSQAIELARERGWSEEPIAVVAYAGLGVIRVRQMRLAEADADALLGRAERALRSEVEPSAEALLFVLHPAPELLQRHVRRGATHAAPMAEILSTLAPPGGLGVSLPLKPHEQLSRSEARVLRFLTTSLSVPEIADQLYVSVNTVRTHMRHVYEKLGAHRRAEAIDRARTLGLLTPSYRHSP